MSVERCNYSCLRDAVKTGDVCCLKTTLERYGLEIDEPDHNTRDRFTALHWSCYWGKLECLRWLLWQDSSCCDVRSARGWTPIHVAAIHSHSSCIKALCRSGANVNLKDDRGYSAAHLAVVHGTTGSLRMLLNSGTDVNSVCATNGWTLMHTAAFHGRLGCIQLLLKRGAKIDDIDADGNTPAHLAAMEGHVDCLRFIIEYVANWYPVASNTGSWHPVLSARNNLGHVPLTVAKQFRKSIIVRYIEELMEDLAAGMPHDQDNAERRLRIDAYLAHRAAYFGDLAQLEKMIEMNLVKVDKPDDFGSTLLHKAAGQGHLDIVTLLLSYGADIKARNQGNETARDVAVRFGRLAVIKLLTHGVNSLGVDAAQEDAKHLRRSSTSDDDSDENIDSNSKHQQQRRSTTGKQEVGQKESGSQLSDDASTVGSNEQQNNKQQSIDDHGKQENDLEEAAKSMNELCRQFLIARRNYEQFGGKVRLSRVLPADAEVDEEEEKRHQEELITNERRKEISELMDYEQQRQTSLDEEILNYRCLILKLGDELDQRRACLSQCKMSDKNGSKTRRKKKRTCKKKQKMMTPGYFVQRKVAVERQQTKTTEEWCAEIDKLLGLKNNVNDTSSDESLKDDKCHKCEKKSSDDLLSGFKVDVDACSDESNADFGCRDVPDVPKCLGGRSDLPKCLKREVKRSDDLQQESLLQCEVDPIPDPAPALDKCINLDRKLEDSEDDGSCPCPGKLDKASTNEDQLLQDKHEGLREVESAAAAVNVDSDSSSSC